MFDSIRIRLYVAYLIAVLVAVIAGYFLATPDSLSSIFFVFSAITLLVLPALFRWYHLLLILSLNSTFEFSFLPGTPSLWILMAGASLLLTVLNRTMQKTGGSIHIPTVSWALVFLALVCVVTAAMTGGLGLNITGANVYGSKRYIYIFSAIAVYFALVGNAIQAKDALFCIKCWCLPSVIAVLSNLVYMLGPTFYFLYTILPVGGLFSQMGAEMDVSGNTVSRISGLAIAGPLITLCALCHWGAIGILDIRKPHRLIFTLLFLLVSLFSGFRSVLVLMTALFAFTFYLEGGFKKPVFIGATAIGITLLILLFPFAKQLPRSVQRTLSFIPGIEVDAIAAAEARGSSEWRFEMWNLLLPQIPQYLILGKGYGIDKTEQYLLGEAVKRGLAANYELPILTGDFHNGPLSVIIPFGIFGLISIIWFLVASLWVLRRNYLYGLPELKQINRCLYAYCIIKAMFFVFVFGALNADLVAFVSIIGISISLNNGVAKESPASS